MSINIEPELTFSTPARIRSKRKPPTLTFNPSSNHSTSSLHQTSPSDSLFPNSPRPPSYLSRSGSLGLGSPHNAAPPAYTSPRPSADSGITHLLDAYPFVLEYETLSSATPYDALKRNSIGSSVTSFNTADDVFTSYVSPEPRGFDKYMTSTSNHGHDKSRAQVIILETDNPESHSFNQSASTPTHIRTLPPGRPVPESTVTAHCSAALPSSPHLVIARIPSSTPSEGGAYATTRARSPRWQLPSEVDEQGESEVSTPRVTIFPRKPVKEKKASTDDAGSLFHFENWDTEMVPDDEEDTESEKEDTRDTNEPETMIPRERILFGLPSNGSLKAQRSAGSIRGLGDSILDDNDNISSSSSSAELKASKIVKIVKEGKQKEPGVKELEDLLVWVQASEPRTDEAMVPSELKVRIENRQWKQRKRDSELDLQASTAFIFRSPHSITHRSSVPLLNSSSLSEAQFTTQTHHGHSSYDKPLPALPINFSSISFPQGKYPEQYIDNDHDAQVTQTAGEGIGDRPRKGSKASRTLSALSKKSSAWALSMVNAKPKLESLKTKGLDSFKRGTSSFNSHSVSLANPIDGREDKVTPTSRSGSGVSGSGEPRPDTSRPRMLKMNSFNSNSAKMMGSLNALKVRDSVQMKQMKDSFGRMVKRPKSSQGIVSSTSFNTATPSALFSPRPRSSQSHIPSSSITTSTSGLPTSPRRQSALNFFSEKLEEHKKPSAVQIKEAYRLGVFDEHGMELTFGSVVEGKGKVAEKCIVCFIRHFWCPMCQDYMYSIARSVDPKWLEQSRVRLVIISNGSWKMIKAYKRIFHFPFSLYTDPSLALYATLGMTLKTLDGGPESEKGMYVQHGLVGGIAMVVGNAVRARVPVWEAGGDTEQLGGEFVFGPGMKCTFAHRMRTTRAHIPIEKVLAAAGVDMPLAPSAQRPLSEEDELVLAEERRTSLAQLQEEVEKGTIEIDEGDGNSEELVFAPLPMRASFDQLVASPSIADGYSHTHKRIDSTETTKPRRSRSSGQIIATPSAGQWRGTAPVYRNIKDPFPQLSTFRSGTSNGSITSVNGQATAVPSNLATATSARSGTDSRPSSAIASCPNSAISTSRRPATAPRSSITSAEARPDTTTSHPGAGNKVTLKLVEGKWTQAEDVTDADDTTEAGTEASSDSDSTISSLEG